MTSTPIEIQLNTLFQTTWIVDFAIIKVHGPKMFAYIIYPLIYEHLNNP